MNPFDEQQKYLTGASATASRRRFLGVSTKIVGAGTLVVAAGAQTMTMTGDIEILNYALTLEHLEAAFYVQALQRFTGSELGNSQAAAVLGTTGAGNILPYLTAIRDHETTHVTTLIQVIRQLGGTPVQPCTYNFGFTTVDAMLATAAVLENTGVSAYDGAVNQIQSRDLQQAAATIATVEARHAAYLNMLTGQSPFPAAFDTARTRAEILAAAAPFLTGCGAGGSGSATAGTTASLQPQNLNTIDRQVTLNTSGSRAANGGALTYLTEVVSGPAAIIGGTTASPIVQLNGGTGTTYTIRLTVTDSTGATAQATTNITYSGR